MRENPVFSRVLRKSVQGKTVEKTGKNSRSYYSLFSRLDTNFVEKCIEGVSSMKKLHISSYKTASISALADAKKQ